MEQITVAQIRVGMKISQSTMADLLEMTRHTYQRKETGKAEWLVNEIDKLIDLSGYKYEQIKF